MAVIELAKTPFADQFREYLKEKRCYIIPEDAKAESIVACVLWAAGSYLSALENKKDVTNGIYFYLTENPENKIFGTILEYDKNEENEENPGAFEFTTTYDNELIEKKTNIPMNNDLFIQALGNSLAQKGGMLINEVGFRMIIISDALDFLKRFVENQVQADPSTVVEFEHPGIYVVRGGVEDGKVIISMTPGADLKSKAIKDDAASEKTN